ncbi:MAG: hypothetical protein K6T92_02540, partial [Candidatus Rokubacteria bacterium]|nr:hypothetical protein [Candidatus Rokubacteria bacterium]
MHRPRIARLRQPAGAALVVLSVALLLATGGAGSVRPLAAMQASLTRLPETLPETLSAGAQHTCVITADETVACWGRDDAGQATPPAGRFIQVSGGATHTCGLRRDMTVICWGSNDHGEATPPAD